MIAHLIHNLTSEEPEQGSISLKPIVLSPLSETPLVSVILANYNYDAYLAEAIESVLGQRYAHLELIVVDDGSTDSSGEVLAALEGSDPRLTVLLQENSGQVSAWNNAFTHCRGDIITFLDSDDRFTIDKLEKVVSAFKQQPNAGVVTHRYQPTLADGTAARIPLPEKLESGWLAQTALERGGWKADGHPASLTLRREVLQAMFPLPPELGFGDAYILGIAQFLTEFIALPEVLYCYRIHGSNDSGSLDPSAKSLQTILNIFATVNPWVRAFVAASFGDEVAAQLHMKDIPHYWDHALAAYVLSGKPRDGIPGHSRHELMSHLSDTTAGRRKWRLILALPDWIGPPALQFWWRKTLWKTRVRSIVKRLRKTPATRRSWALQPIDLQPLPAEPFVSIIMSNYNYAQFLAMAIGSVIQQTYPHWELIVCDDGSTDTSADVLDELAGRDARIRVIYKENGGQASAWNEAFGHCNGDIIGYLDSDDRFHPEKLERVVQVFREHPRAGLLCHPLQPVSSGGDSIGEPVPGVIDSGWRADTALETGGWGRWPPTSGICIRREVADRVFPMPGSHRFRRGGADSFTASASQFLTEAIAVQDALAEYRIHDSNYVGFSRPTVSTISKLAQDVVAITEALSAFVGQEFGSDIAARVTIENVRQYWECILGLYILQGKPRDGIDGHSPKDMLAHLPASRRNIIWRVLVGLPAPISKQILPLWWGTSPWKRYLRPIAARMGIR